jgi:nucleosome binding factor SPN SPT16 subunit
LHNHQEYIEKAIKPIAKAKYRDKTKKREEKWNRLREQKKNLLQQKQRDYLRFLITPRFDVIRRSLKVISCITEV